MGVTELKQATQVTMTSSSKGRGEYPYMEPEMFKKAERGCAVGGQHRRGVVLLRHLLTRMFVLGSFQ